MTVFILIIYITFSKPVVHDATLLHQITSGYYLYKLSIALHNRLSFNLCCLDLVFVLKIFTINSTQNIIHALLISNTG